LPGDLSVIIPRRLRAPTEDRAVMALPPLNEAGSLLVANRERFAGTRIQILGRPLAGLRREGRDAAFSAACDYLRQAGEPLPPGDSSSLILAGHQPELFHPGVWVKNFALHGLARAHGAAPLNLVVDNDAGKSAAVSIPVVEGEHAGSRLVSFDRWEREVPFEERTVLDEGLFAGFPEQAGQATQHWNFAPMIGDFWKEVLHQAKHTRLLGERFASARRSFERGWGCHNLEVPVSALCRSEPFAWFICDLLARLNRFHEVYNDSLRDYRRLYRLRSRSHPVPDLEEENGWRELPLWAWRADNPQRARLFVRRDGDTLYLRAGKQPWPSLPFQPERDPGAAVAAWMDLERQGFKVRSRALTNTLFARLFVGDLFIHGIGGAKYDELTDEIIRRFYGCEPPGYLVLSATLLLPFEQRGNGQSDFHRLQHKIRDLAYNPQRHLAPEQLTDPQARVLNAQKQEWIGKDPSDHVGRQHRFQVLQQLTQELRPYTSAQIGQLQDEQRHLEKRLQVNRVLQHRDYAFCLYPEALLRDFCRQFLQAD
jgi:hypothetical protein